MTSCGSKIITTTRVNDVADSCQSSFNGHVYNIKHLDKVHSRQLFYRRLFHSEEECPPHLKEVSDHILEKCAGLPFAIIAISGLFANTERIEHLWNRVKDSIGCALEMNDSVEGMMKILSLSYFDLPPCLKTCLLYLSVFPEDYIIEKPDLIRRWIAEGFIHKEDRYTSYEVGERCFNELLNRSLIQPMKTDEYDAVKSCRVHDTILDFVIAKSIEDNFVTLIGFPNLTIETQRNGRRLSLQVGKQKNSILPAGWVFSHVRSLTVFGNSGEIPCLDEFRHLRVLDLGGYHQLVNRHLVNIGRLFQLRYLSIRGTGVSELPEQIGHLQCLELLDVTFNRIGRLPTTIVNLGQLVNLFIGGPLKFPDGIVKMQSLQMLQRVDVFSQSVKFLEDLGQLKNLRKLQLDLCISSGMEVTAGAKEEYMQAIAHSLRELGTHNLRSLTLWDDGSSLLAEPWSPAPIGLQELMTHWSPVPQIPDWVVSLTNLQQLRLQVEGVRQKDLCILGGLPALLILELEGTRSKENLRVSDGVGFPCLRKFCYSIPWEGMEMMFAAGSMLKLENLEICFDAEKTESLFGANAGAFDFGIENLPCLITVICQATQEYCSDNRSIEATKSAMDKAISTHPKRPTLRF